MIFAIIVFIMIFLSLPIVCIASVYKALGIFPTIAAKRELKKERAKQLEFETKVQQKEKEIRANLKRFNEEKLILQEAWRRIEKNP
jgi:hypothetical protein